MGRTFLATHEGAIQRAAESEDGWQVRTVLGGQNARCLARDPGGTGMAYAGTHGVGVWRTVDGGESWRPSGLEGRVVSSLAISALQPGTLYAGLKPAALCVSRDWGASWSELRGFSRVRAWWWRSPAEADLVAYVQAIALSPTDPRVILAGIEAGAVMRSSDGGDTWDGHRPGALRDCHSLICHATEGDWAYEAGGTGAGAAFSRDSGKTWQQPRTGLDRHYGWACAADPADAAIWYMSASPYPRLASAPPAHVDGHANASIYRSVGGSAWHRLGGGLPDPLDHMAYALITDPRAPGHLYAGLSSGHVWHSKDHGDTWTRLPFGMAGIHRALILL